MQHKSTVSVYIQEIAENQNTLELLCILSIVTIYFQGWLKTSQVLPDTKWFDHIEGNLRFFPCMSADLGWVSKMFATTSKFTMLAYELAIQFCT